MNFKTFFKQKTIRFFIIVFAALLIVSNVVVYGSSTIQYEREHEREMDGYRDMMRHLLTMEDTDAAITYTTHYYHTQGIRLSVYDQNETLLYTTEQLPNGNDLIPITNDDGQVIAYFTYDDQDSIFGKELTIALIIINGLSILLFFSAIRSLYWYINKTYQLLEKDLDNLGHSNRDFYFSDLASVSQRLVHLIKSEKQMRDVQKAYVKVLAHDIKTPLTVLKAYVDGLKLGKIRLDEPALEDMIEEINHIEELMPQLLTQKSNHKKESHSLKPFIEETIQRYLQLFKSKNIQIVKNLEDINLDIAFEDMKRMVENLLSNAFHYSLTNQTIYIKLSQHQLVIQDEGIGMDDMTLNQVKKGPYRSQKAHEQYEQGSGLGLQIVFDIIDHYGYNIQFDTNPNQGLCVTVTFK
jgi:signal transduction histidine kinase